MLHNIELEEDELAGLEDLKPKSLSSREIQELQKQQRKKQASLPRHKVTPTSGRKDKAPQVEERAKVPKRRSLFSVVAEALNEIRDLSQYE